MVRTPYMAGLFGWDEPHPDPEPVRAAWEQAEAATNRGFATHLAGPRRGRPQGARPPAGGRPGRDQLT